MALAMRSLYPSDEDVRGWTFESALAWAKVSPEQWQAVVAKLGDANLRDFDLLAAIPESDMAKAVADWRQEVSASVVDVTRLAMLVNGIRLRYGVVPTDWLTPRPGPPVVAPPAPGAPPSAGLVGLPAGAQSAGSTVVKVRLSTVIDQGLDQEIALLAGEHLTALRARYIAHFGEAPLPECEVTDEQLSALAFKVEAGRAPFTDFGVWHPHGARFARKMKFVSQQLSADGTWKTVELPGPPDLQAWRACWSVFKSAAIMCGLAAQGPLDR